MLTGELPVIVCRLLSKMSLLLAALVLLKLTLAPFVDHVPVPAVPEIVSAVSVELTLMPVPAFSVLSSVPSFVSWLVPPTLFTLMLIWSPSTVVEPPTDTFPFVEVIVVFAPLTVNLPVFALAVVD